MERDIALFLTRELISLADGQAVGNRLRALCATLAPFALQLTDAFGIPDKVLQAPIGLEWIKYNRTDNQGEVNGSSTPF